MARSSFQHMQVRGVVAVVPRHERCLDDEIDLFGGDAAQIARIKRTIGLDRRRVVQPGVTAADLCESAARELFKRLALEPGSIDAVINVTQTPDYSQPANACVLHGKLGLDKGCAAFDVNLGCSGYVYALWLAGLMVEGGALRRVVVLAGDTISRIVHPRDRAVAPLFGDAGSATLVEYTEAPRASWFTLNTDGKGCGHLIVPAGGFRQPADESTCAEVTDAEGNVRSAETLYMNGAEVFNFSLREEPASVTDLCAWANKPLGSIDAFVFHQANRFILSNIARKLKIPLEKVPMGTVEKYGNQSSASVPVALCDGLGQQLVEAPATVLLSGFGVGLSWASCILDQAQLACAEVIEY